MNFVSVRSTELLSKYFGQTEASIRSVFKQVSPTPKGLRGRYVVTHVLHSQSTLL